MKTVGEKIEAFKVTGVKPGFNHHEEDGRSAFETITEASFPGKWKVIYFYPKDFTFVCPTEIVGFAKLEKDFADRLNRLADISQQQAIIEELDRATYYIERNANAKILFHALTIKLYHIIQDKIVFLTT